MPQIDEAALRRLKETDPEKYQRALELTAKLPEIAERNPLTQLNPDKHPKQKDFWASKDPLKAFQGGNQSGKSTAGVIDDLIQACDEDDIPAVLRPYKKWKPPFYCRVMIPDYKHTLENILETVRDWCPKTAYLGGSFDDAYDKQNSVLRFSNGSRMDFVTHEQDRDKLGSVTLHRVHYDEEPPRTHRQESQMRLVRYAGDEIFTLTPLLGISWSFDEIFERRNEPGITVVEVATDENPYLDKETVERQFATMTKEEQEARRYGRYVHFQGLVFPEFSNRHLIAPLPKSHLKDQTVVEGIDPGINFAGAVWIAFDKENRAVAFDELFLRDTPSLEYLAQAIKHKRAEHGIEVDYSVIDPSARNRTVSVEAERIEAELQRFGIFCIHGQNDHEAGAFQIKRRLQAEPEPALFVTENCRELTKEFRRLRIKETEDGSFKILKEASPNARNEVIDSLRYALMSRPWAFTPSRDAPSRQGWRPDYAPPYEWFEDRRGRTAPPMGSFT